MHQEITQYIRWRRCKHLHASPPNPVIPRRHRLKPGRRLPRAVAITSPRDRAIFTLLLNAGAPTRSVTVQRVLGHRYVQTTLHYARIYDSGIARDYGRVIIGVEGEDDRPVSKVSSHSQ